MTAPALTGSEPAASAEQVSPPALSTGAALVFSSGTIGMNLVPMFLSSWQVYYFCPPADSGRIVYASMAAIGIANFAGQIVHSIADGLIGSASDRTKTRWGRRIPWIAISTPICVAAFIALWWPPMATTSWVNVAWLVAIRAILWVAYTGVYGPYCSLYPELTHGKQRIRVSLFMAVFDVVGTVLATAAAPAIIDAAPHGARLGPIVLSDGYKLAAVITGLIALATMVASIAAVKERPHDASKDVPFGMWRAIKETLRNPAFRPYVLSFVTFRIGLSAILALMPYQVGVILGIKEIEAVAGTLLTVIILGSVLLFPVVDKLAGRFGKRRVMLWGFLGFAGVMCAAGLIGKVPVGSPIAQAYAVYACATFPVATLYVLSRPILADIIDTDQTLTGFRREGMYNGAEGLLTKVAEGFGPLVMAIMFGLFGNTSDNSLGVALTAPVAGMMCLAGWLTFRRYPIES